MRILHIITSLQTGGAEKLMVDLLPRFRDMGHEVDLLIFNGERTPFYKTLESCGIKIHSLRSGSGSVYKFGNIFALRRFLKEYKYDLVHTHNYAPQLFTALASMGMRHKLVTTEHSSDNRRRRYPILKPLDEWMYGRYASVVCIAEPSYNALTSYLGRSDNRISIIKNGVDIGKYTFPINKPNSDSEITVSMVAGFRYEKDQDTLIRAIAALPSNYTLRLIGDGRRRGELEQLVSSLGVDKRVEFTGVRSDIPELLSQSDIVVMSSHSEGLSLSSVEGMASGRPFIASDVNGLREVVKGAGVLFPHEDVESLANEIRRLCENADEYRRVAEACQARASQYSIEKTAEEYDSLYKQL